MASQSTANKSGVLPNPRKWRMGIYVGVMLDDDTLHMAFYTQDIPSSNVHVYGTEMKNYDSSRNTAQYQPRDFWIPNKQYNEVDYLKSFGDKAEMLEFRGPAGNWESVLEGTQVDQMRTIMNTIPPRWSAEWIYYLVRELEKAGIIYQPPGYSKQVQSYIEDFRDKQKQRARRR